MQSVHVNTAQPYDVLVETGLLDSLGNLIGRRFPGAKCFVVSDANVMALYGARVINGLRDAHIETRSLSFAPGESSKTMHTIEVILSEMNRAEMTRSDLVIALGGGITGDMAGFAASIYMRGIRFVQIPTTLLAAVDASVGGKTGVNMGGLKNQVGTFWQPSMVIIDPSTMDTLPGRELACGMAEVVKYGCIRDAEIIRMAEELARIAATPTPCGDRTDIHKVLENMILRCVAIKAQVVETDERDTGERMLLNFGHTIGHAVEKCTGGAVQHGEAVAIGMVAMARTAENKNMCPAGYTDRLATVLEGLGLPTVCPVDGEDILGAIRSDKKRAGQTISLVMPDGIGHCSIVPVDIEILTDYLAI